MFCFSPRDNLGENEREREGSWVHLAITPIFFGYVKIDEFGDTRALSFLPPAGEFTLLSYRSSSGIILSHSLLLFSSFLSLVLFPFLFFDFLFSVGRLPFRVFPFIEERADPLTLDICIKCHLSLVFLAPLVLSFSYTPMNVILVLVIIL
jgi:hypothetical protein